METGDGQIRNGTAAALLLAAVLLASTSPAAAVIADGDQTPFLFNASLRLGTAAGFAAITIGIFRGRLAGELRNLARCPELLREWGPLAAVVGTLEYTLYAMATKNIDPAIAVTLMETWPAMIIAVGTMRSRNTGRYKPMSKRTAAAAGATVGAALLVASQHGSIASLWPSTSRDGENILLGAVLALASAATLAPTPIAIGWCEKAAAVLREKCDSSTRDLPILCIGTLMVTGCLTGAALNGAAAAVTGEKITAHAVTAPLICGILTQGPGAMAWRVANTLTDNPNLNIILFGLPVMGMAWIWLLGAVSVESTELLLAGTALIVDANLLAGTASRKPGNAKGPREMNTGGPEE